MVQSKKNVIEERILNTAKKIFLVSGFKDCSIRNIAKELNISKSNIYTYFDSKDALFSKIIQPTINQIQLYLDQMKYPENFPPKTYGFKYHLEIIKKVAYFIDQHRENFTLLIFKSNGSSYENYFDQIIDYYTERSIVQMTVFTEKINCKRKNISQFCTHNMISSYANFIKEVIMHQIPREKIIEYGEEIMTISYYGSKALFGWSDEIDQL